MSWWTILAACGIPSGFFGILFWYFKNKWIKAEEEKAQHQKNLENLVLMMLQSTRANSDLCVETAKAVRDGHCNGNMKKALEAVEAVAAKEKEFLLDMGIKYILE